ncbi:MAG: serine/threonine protein kinase [Fibromonadales bacterium]|nr:serine/threonine protein kinase [Fibromonadales bacterium]
MTETFPRPFNADYELLGVLGKGGMGSNVYKARQIRLDRTVALKVLDSMGDEEAEKRFISEAKAMKDFNHENLVSVIDYGTQEGKMFIAMTFISGESLADTIKKKRILPVRDAMQISLEIAKGLRYAHKNGVVHRDIKPANIMMMDSKSNEICIIDFGISIAAGSQRLTSPGMTMGTPEYMSPEQCQNRNVTLQSDIYSLGIVMYEMLSGDPPFVSSGSGAGASLAVLNKHMHEKPEPLRKKNSDVSLALEKVIDKCLEKKTVDRYINFSEFIKDLISVMNGTVEHETTKTLAGRLSGSERMMFLLLFILPVMALFVSLLLYMSIPKIPPSINHLSPGKSWVVINEVKVGESTDSLLFDKDYSTAWNITRKSALTGNDGKLITVKFKKPVFISHVGLASNDPKASKPKDVWIRWEYNKQSDYQKFVLPDAVTPQYVSWTPMEVEELTFMVKSVHNATEDIFSLSEIMLFGVER